MISNPWSNTVRHIYNQLLSQQFVDSKILKVLSQWNSEQNDIKSNERRKTQTSLLVQKEWSRVNYIGIHFSSQSNNNHWASCNISWREDESVWKSVWVSLYLMKTKGLIPKDQNMQLASYSARSIVRCLSIWSTNISRFGVWKSSPIFRPWFQNATGMRV